MIIKVRIDTRWIIENFVNPVAYNPFRSIFALIWVLLAMALSSVLIYLLNYKFTFSKLDIEVKLQKKFSFFLAVFTTPILFLLPTQWFY